MKTVIIIGVIMIVIFGLLMFAYPGEHDEHDQR